MKVSKKDFINLSLLFDFKKEKQRYYYIVDKWGNIRWIFPDYLDKPTFLLTYNFGSFKAKLLKLFYTTAFFLGVKRFVTSGSFSASLKKKFNMTLSYLGCNRYSIFLGTPGISRKAVIEVGKKSGTVAFVKIPLTGFSRKLVENERKILEYLSKYKFTNLVIPKVLLDCEGTVAISALKDIEKGRNLLNIETSHLKALKELYLCSSRKVKLSFIVKEIEENLEKFIKFSQGQEVHILFAQLFDLLRLSLKFLRKFEFENISVALGHRDFTPWNMFFFDGKIHLFDWELASFNTPLFFDFFHHLYQTNALIKNLQGKKLFSKVLSDIEKVEPYLSDWIEDINLYHLLYLSIVSSFYLWNYYLSTKIKDFTERNIFALKNWIFCLRQIIYIMGGNVEISKEIF